MEVQMKSALETFLESTVAKNKNKQLLGKIITPKIIENITKEVITRLFILVAFILILVVVSVSFAYWISEKMGNPYYGLIIISSVYFITIIVTSLVTNRWIDKSLMNLVISKILM
jgi:hypothetical protein